MKQQRLLVVAIVILFVAGVLIAFQMRGGTRLRDSTEAIDVEGQVAAIQNNTHMPEGMKASAIAQIRAHAGGSKAQPAAK